MTPNELADQIKNRLGGNLYNGLDLACATMLRQQQALIDGADVVIKESQDRFSQKCAEIESLKKQLGAGKQ